LLAEDTADELRRTLNESLDDGPLLDSSEYRDGNAEQYQDPELTFAVEEYLDSSAWMSPPPSNSTTADV